MADFFGVSQGRCSMLSITTGVTVKGIPGRIQRIQVLVAGTGAGGVYDSGTVSGVTAALLVGIAPAVAGSYLIDMPCLSGVTVVPGPGQTLAVSYD